jgi:hypothetical protein
MESLKPLASLESVPRPACQTLFGLAMELFRLQASQNNNRPARIEGGSESTYGGPDAGPIGAPLVQTRRTPWAARPFVCLSVSALRDRRANHNRTRTLSNSRTALMCGGPLTASECQSGGVDRPLEEASMAQANTIGWRSRSMSSKRTGRCGRPRGVPQAPGAGGAARVLRCPAAVRGGDGGLRLSLSLGTRDRQAGPHRATDPAYLRRAVSGAAEERHGGCRGDLRSRAAADHALRAGEQRGATGERCGVPGAGPAGAPAHPVHQGSARAPLRIRLNRSPRHHTCRCRGRPRGSAATSGPKHRRCNVHSGLASCSRGPRPSVAGACTLVPAGNHHIRDEARTNLVECLVRRPPAARTTGTARPNAVRRACRRRSLAVKSERSGRGAAMANLALFVRLRITSRPASGSPRVSHCSRGLVLLAVHAALTGPPVSAAGGARRPPAFSASSARACRHGAKCPASHRPK